MTPRIVMLSAAKHLAHSARQATGALALVGAISISLAVGCGTNGNSKAAPTLRNDSPSAMTLDQAKAYEGLTLYWLGDTYQGLPLTKIHHYTPTEVDFIYGTCTTEDPSGECSLPFELQEQPNCAVTPDMIATQAELNNMAQIRSADALVEPGNGIQLWTGDITIKIYNDTLDEQAERAVAEALVPIKDANASPNDPLPATIPCGTSLQ